MRLLERVNGQIQVVAVDDQPTYVHGLRVLIDTLAEDVEVTAVATTPEEGFQRVAEHLPDIVLLDVRMPHGGGLSLARRIRDRFPAMKIAMLSAYDDPSLVHEALSIGVNAYLSKEAEPEELVSAVRAVQAGDVVLARFAASAISGRPQARGVPLTDLELNVLQLLSEGAPHVQIARRLAMSSSTLKRQILQIQRKLGVTNRIQAIVAAVRRGIV